MSDKTLSQVDASKPRWYENVVFVAVLLLVLGPFGFPWLFKCRCFSIRAKWIIDLLVTAETVYSIYLMVVVMQQILEYFKNTGLL